VWLSPIIALNDTREKTPPTSRIPEYLVWGIRGRRGRRKVSGARRCLPGDLGLPTSGPIQVSGTVLEQSLDANT
jgi:hypothetical protein